MNLEKLLEAKQYKNPNGIIYPSIASLVEPWLNQIDQYTDEYQVRVIKPNFSTVEEKGEVEIEYEIYTRFVIEAVLNNRYQFNFKGDDNYKSTFGFLGFFDTTKPGVKLYNGFLRGVCLNLNVFRPQQIIKEDFASETFMKIYDFVPEAIKNHEAEVEEFQVTMHDFFNVVYSGTALNEIIGAIGRKCAQSDGILTAYTNMIKLLSSSASLKNIPNIYYNKDKSYTKYEIYNAFTNTITTKNDFVNRANHCLKAFQLFKS